MAPMRAVLVVIFLILPALVMAGDNLAARHAGSWYGVGYQDDGQVWEIHVTLSPRQGRIVYPGLSCGGPWQYGASFADHIEATERLDYGHDNCMDNVPVRLSEHGKDRLQVLWTFADGSDLAIAILRPGKPHERGLREAAGDSREAWRARALPSAPGGSG